MSDVLRCDGLEPTGDRRRMRFGMTAQEAKFGMTEGFRDDRKLEVRIRRFKAARHTWL